MKPVSVLIVDDNPMFLGILTDFLRINHENDVTVVATASRTEDGLARARELRPQAVLLDLAMPDLTGLKAIPRLRRMLPEVGIIAVSMLEPTPYRQAALEAGADEFVSKTSLTTDLLPAIRRVTQERAGEQTSREHSAREGGER